MSKREQPDKIWIKFANKLYREEYALGMLKRMIPYQIMAIRKKRGESQITLAEKSHLSQGVISRAENPYYGNLTLTTIGRIAGGFDMAAIVRFVSFGELVNFFNENSEREFAELPTFTEEATGVCANLSQSPTREQIATTQLSEKLYKRWRAKQEDTYVYGTVVPPRDLVSWVRDFGCGGQKWKKRKSAGKMGSGGRKTRTSV